MPAVDTVLGLSKLNQHSTFSLQFLGLMIQKCKSSIFVHFEFWVSHYLLIPLFFFYEVLLLMILCYIRNDSP